MHQGLQAHPGADQLADDPTCGLPVGHVCTLLRSVFPTTMPDFQVMPLRGDASDRRYYRLFFNPPTADLASLVLMRLAQPYTAGELPFVNVQRYLALKGVPVPRIFCDDSTRGFVLLEDLGDMTLEGAWPGASQEQRASWYRQALDILIVLQHPEPPLPRQNCVAFRLAFDVDKLMWELDFFITHMLKGLCRRQLTATVEATMRGRLWQLTAILARQPRLLTHRDYHSRNLMLHEGCLRVIDFQDARLGPCQYDLASLLYDSYVVLPSDLREQLLTSYLDRKAEVDRQRLDRGEFEQLFDYMCLQRNLKALGTFAFQTVAKGNRRYVPSILPTVEYVRENLARHPELRVLREILAEHLFAALPAVLPGVERRIPDTSPAR